MAAVDVCICTYRRPSLADALASLAGQSSDAPSFRVIVADNDSTDRRKDEVEALGRALKLDLLYIHAPQSNISVARNACLDAASAEWIAFIDDDEVADERWLATLYDHRRNRDVVFGLAKAVYDGQSPAWLADGDFHSAQIDGPNASWNGYSGNVLLRTAFVRDNRLRFDPDWGKAGGEDTLFFFEARRAGARFDYAPAAKVSEMVPGARMSLGWLARRRFRAGQTYAEILRRLGRHRSGAVLAALKCAATLGMAGLSFWDRPRAARQLLRSSLHAGVVASAFGVRPLALYEARQGSV